MFSNTQQSKTVLELLKKDKLTLAEDEVQQVWEFLQDINSRIDEIYFSYKSNPFNIHVLNNFNSLPDMYSFILNSLYSKEELNEMLKQEDFPLVINSNNSFIFKINSDGNLPEAEEFKKLIEIVNNGFVRKYSNNENTIVTHFDFPSVSLKSDLKLTEIKLNKLKAKILSPSEKRKQLGMVVIDVEALQLAHRFEPVFGAQLIEHANFISSIDHVELVDSKSENELTVYMPNSKLSKKIFNRSELHTIREELDRDLEQIKEYISSNTMQELALSELTNEIVASLNKAISEIDSLINELEINNKKLFERNIERQKLKKEKKENERIRERQENIEKEKNESERNTIRNRYVKQDEKLILNNQQREELAAKKKEWKDTFDKKLLRIYSDTTGTLQAQAFMNLENNLNQKFIFDSYREIINSQRRRNFVPELASYEKLSAYQINEIVMQALRSEIKKGLKNDKLPDNFYNDKPVTLTEAVSHYAISQIEDMNQYYQKQIFKETDVHSKKITDVNEFYLKEEKEQLENLHKDEESLLESKQNELKSLEVEEEESLQALKEYFKHNFDNTRNQLLQKLESLKDDRSQAIASQNIIYLGKLDKLKKDFSQRLEKEKKHLEKEKKHNEEQLKLELENIKLSLSTQKSVLEKTHLKELTELEDKQIEKIRELREKIEFQSDVGPDSLELNGQFSSQEDEILQLETQQYNERKQLKQKHQKEIQAFETESNAKYNAKYNEVENKLGNQRRELRKISQPLQLQLEFNRKSYQLKKKLDKEIKEIEKKFEENSNAAIKHFNEVIPKQIENLEAKYKENSEQIKNEIKTKSEKVNEEIQKIKEEIQRRILNRSEFLIKRTQKIKNKLNERKQNKVAAYAKDHSQQLYAWRANRELFCMELENLGDKYLISNNNNKSVLKAKAEITKLFGSLSPKTFDEKLSAERIERLITGKYSQDRKGHERETTNYSREEIISILKVEYQVLKGRSKKLATLIENYFQLIGLNNRDLNISSRQLPLEKLVTKGAEELFAYVADTENNILKQDGADEALRNIGKYAYQLLLCKNNQDLKQFQNGIVGITQSSQGTELEPILKNIKSMIDERLNLATIRGDDPEALYEKYRDAIAKVKTNTRRSADIKKELLIKLKNISDNPSMDSVSKCSDMRILIRHAKRDFGDVHFKQPFKLWGMQFGSELRSVLAKFSTDFTPVARQEIVRVERKRNERNRDERNREVVPVNKMVREEVKNEREVREEVQEVKKEKIDTSQNMSTGIGSMNMLEEKRLAEKRAKGVRGKEKDKKDKNKVTGKKKG